MSATDRAFVGSIPEVYDRCLGPMLFEPYALEMAGRFKGFTGALLETAAGTGRVTRHLASVAPAAKITATDLNEPMLAKAGALMAAANVEWRQADAQALPFEDRSFDAVVCQFGVMFYPDKPAGFREAHRVLKPGGRYVFNVWDDLAANEISQAVHEALAKAFPDDPPAFLSRTPFGYHDDGHIRAELAQAGFGGVAIETVEREMRSESAQAAAEGLCTGTPLLGEIEARKPGGAAEVTAAVAQALTRTFGNGAIVGKGQALVITASV